MANNQIALLARAPEFDTPFESQGKALQLRQLMNQGQVQDMDMAQRRQAIADDQQTRDISSRFSDPLQRIAELYKVNPKAAMRMQKFQQESDKSAADIEETKGKTSKSKIDVAMKQYDALGQAIGSLKQVPGGATQQHVTMAVQRLVDMGVIDGPTAQKVISEVPQNPQQIAAWLDQGQASVMSAKDQLAQTTPDANARLSAQTQIENSKRTAASSKYSTDSAATNARLAREQRQGELVGESGGPTQAAFVKQFGKPAPGYRWKADGSQESIPGGPADVKSNAVAQQKALGASDVESAVATLRNAYDRLEQGGGITSTKSGALGNMAASSSSSAIGQAMGKAFGTQNQSARNDVAMTRPALLAALMKATGMSAKQMDSNAELKLWLATATDPTLDVQSNRRALDAIEQKYLGAGAQPAKPAATPAGAKFLGFE